ncbi:MAG: IS256 family transposase, partial [Acidimicrobiia bacterium]
ERAYQKTPIRQEPAEERPLQLRFDRRRVFAEMQEGLHQFGVKLGLELTAELMKEEVERLCGARYAHQAERQATRYGSQPGVVTIASQKMRIRRPRVRSGRDGKEIPLELYGMAQREEAMPEAVLRRMVRGVSCRNYEGVIETAKESLGVKRSSVSRSFHFASKKKIAELAERRFDGVRFPVIFIDGLCWAGTTMIVALGVAVNGQKHILGFREGRTENAVVCTALLEELIERGISTEQGTLFVIDGSRALRRSIVDLWRDRAHIQRCQAHKKRNLRGHVPEKLWPDVEKLLLRAWRETSAKEAMKHLQTLAAYLDRIAPDAAGSLREGMEETITVVRMKIAPGLLPHLRTTNPIESAFSTTRRLTRRVTNWRNGNMKHRWCATGLLEAERRFRRLKNYEHLDGLVAILDGTQNAVSEEKSA